MWVPRNGDRWYFLEEWYPAYGNLVPRDIAAQAIYKVVYDMRLGIDGEEAVYLDVTHKDPEELTVKLGECSRSTRSSWVTIRERCP